MYGVVSQMGLMAGPDPYVPVDPNALAYMDFVAQIYELEGGPSTLTEMLSGTDPGGFSANGMKVKWDNSNRPVAIGALHTLVADGLANGITLLFEMEMEGAGGGTLLGVNDADYTEYIWVNSQPGAADSGDMNFGSSSLAMNEPGLNRIAFTFSRDLGGGSWRNAVSVNGSVVSGVSGGHWQNLAYALASRFLTGIAAVKLGDVSDWDDTNDFDFFRKFAVYGPMDDAALADLTYGDGISATGGTITTDGDYRVHTFTSDGTFEVASGIGAVEYLIAAGGGGGGSHRGGGGGAGGMRTGTAAVSAGSYPIIVGAGGAGGTAGGRGANGGNSSFNSISCTGGGGGGGGTTNNSGLAGGSGGGRAGTTGSPGSGSSGQGTSGGLSGGSGNSGGGGGGKGTSGSHAASGVGGAGGNGSASSITGTSLNYAAGGGGGSTGTAGAGGSSGVGGSGNSGTSGTPGNGMNGRGGGGGGSGDTSIAGGNGGSGVVIIRYRIANP